MFLNTIRSVSCALYKSSNRLSIGNNYALKYTRSLHNSVINYNFLSGKEEEVDKESLKDRSAIIPVETSIEYLKSDAYKTTYGDNPVWKEYRRNHKGSLSPNKTRKMCIRAGKISTGNPCPICRDEFLILDYRNVELLEQFISPYSGKLLSFLLTGLCQKQQENLIIAVTKAKNMGLIKFDLPIKHYNYDEYKKSN